MSTIWANRTNKGKVVYNRKPHFWNDRDVERVVKRFADSQEALDVPMMSELADRVLFWIARRLSLDEVAGWAVKVVVQLFDLVRGKAVEPASRSRAISKEDQELLDWMSHQAGSLEGLPEVVDRPSALVWIRAICSTMIEDIDKELTT